MGLIAHTVNMPGNMESGTVNANTFTYTWSFLGKNTPRPEIAFLAQVILIYIVVIGAIINLSLHNGDSRVWISLLCSALGYMLPSPSVHKIRYVPTQPT